MPFTSPNARAVSQMEAACAHARRSAMPISGPLTYALRGACQALAFALLACAVALAANPAGLWIDVPFVPQEKDGCGAAAIAMVIQYWQRQQGQSPAVPAAYAQIERALYSPVAHGVHASAMQRYFEQNGYRTFAFAGKRDDLAQQLAKGRPPIVALEPGPGLPLHYVVVAGLDPQRRLVLVNDPARRKLLEEDDARFEQEWKAAGYWLLLAVPQAPAHE